MSSGWNGIPIRGVGRIRRKLAEMICKQTGLLVDADKIQRTNPYHRRYEDCCAWDCYATKKSGSKYKVHIYSWDTMTACSRGFEIQKDDYTSTGGISVFDIELTAKEDPEL